MQDLRPAIEVYPVHHLPIIKAYADQLGLVSLINHYVPTAMEVDAGTVVRAWYWIRSAAAVRCTAWKSSSPSKTPSCFWVRQYPHALHDDTVGRVLDRLYDFGTMRLFTACAVRAAMRFGLERRYVHFDTTSRSVWGDYQFAETQDLPSR